MNIKNCTIPIAISRKAVKTDQSKVINILCKTFDQNPGVNWLIKKEGNHDRNIKQLMSYAFIKAYNRDGVYISSKEDGVALCYKHNQKIFSWLELFYQLRFVICSVNFFHLKKVLK